MISKEEVRKLVEIVEKETNKNRYDLALELKYGKNYISEMLSPTGKVTENFIDKFSAKYSQYWDNPNNEEGGGIAAEEGADYQKVRQNLKNADKKRIPFYDAPASAGAIETEMTPIHAPAGTIDIGDLLHDSQAAIRIYGNSMIPNYPPGCVVGLSRVTNAFIEPGEVYVIETIDKRMLKRLFYKDDDPESKYITCYSDNIMKFEGGARNGKFAYPPFNLPKEEIKNIFMVTGVVKRNSNSIIINR